MPPPSAPLDEPLDEPLLDVVPEELLDEPLLDVVPEELLDEPLLDVVPEEPLDEPLLDVVPEEPLDEPLLDVIPEEPLDEPLLDVVPEEPPDEVPEDPVPEDELPEFPPSSCELDAFPFPELPHRTETRAQATTSVASAGDGLPARPLASLAMPVASTGVTRRHRGTDTNRMHVSEHGRTDHATREPTRYRAARKLPDCRGAAVPPAPHASTLNGPQIRP